MPSTNLQQSTSPTDSCVDPQISLNSRLQQRDIGEEFGISLVLTDTTAVIGAIGTLTNGNFVTGAVYVFEKKDGVWEEGATLVPTLQEDISFEKWYKCGMSVSLSENFVLSGCPDHEAYGENFYRLCVCTLQSQWHD